MVTEIIKNIILIGRTGNGKSTLANVLSNTNKFNESAGGVSETRDIQIEEFRVNITEDGSQSINYRIVDTIGIGDTQLTPQGVLYKIGQASHVIRDGLNQILFVTGGRFTKEEADAYRLLRQVIFDSNVGRYTTIVRTNFPEFENEQACERDRQALKRENQDLTDIISSVRKIIYVDNPPAVGRFAEMAKESREVSKTILLTYLGTCQETYRPENLDKMNERIKDYMTEEEKLKKEIEEKETLRKQQEEEFRKEMEDIKAQQKKESEENERKFEQKMRDLESQNQQRLQETRQQLQAEHSLQMESLRQQQEQARKDAETRHDREMQNIKQAGEQQTRSIQDQLNLAQQREESLRRDLSQKNNSGAELATLMQQIHIEDQKQEKRREEQRQEYEQRREEQRWEYERQRKELEEQRCRDDEKAKNEAQQKENELKAEMSKKDREHKEQIANLQSNFKKTQEQTAQQVAQQIESLKERIPPRRKCNIM